MLFYPDHLLLSPMEVFILTELLKHLSNISTQIIISVFYFTFSWASYPDLGSGEIQGGKFDCEWGTLAMGTDVPDCVDREGYREIMVCIKSWSRWDW